MNFYNLLKLIPQEVFTAQVKEATKKMFPEVAEKPVVEDGPTDKAILLASIIKNGDFGCKKSSIIQKYNQKNKQFYYRYFKKYI